MHHTLTTAWGWLGGWVLNATTAWLRDGSERVHTGEFSLWCHVCHAFGHQCASTLAGDNAMLKTVFDDFVAGLFGDRRRGRGVHCRLPARAGALLSLAQLLTASIS